MEFDDVFNFSASSFLFGIPINSNFSSITTPDCSNCNVVEKMLDEMGISYKVIDVTNEPEYLQKYPIFTAPGVVIDEKLEFIGIPKRKELAEKLKTS